MTFRSRFYVIVDNVGDRRLQVKSFRAACGNCDMALDLAARPEHLLRKSTEGVMVYLRTLIIPLALAGAALGLSGCADRHQVQKLPNTEGSFILLVDYVTHPLHTHDVIVSLQEKQGIASEVAVFRNIATFNATWLGPEDIQICQQGTVQDYKKSVTINAHDGDHTFHFDYECPPG